MLADAGQRLRAVARDVVAMEESDMKTAIAIVIGALGLVACKDHKPAEHAGTTTTTRGGAAQAVPVTVEEVRTVLLEQRPGESPTIEALDILNDNGVVTLRGMVPDEAMRAELVNRVRAMPNVRGVKDEVRVAPPRQTGAHQDAHVGSTTTTGAPHGHALSRADAVRASMASARPGQESVVRALSITEEANGDVLVSGVVPDDKTRDALLDAAKKTPGVRHVHDDVKIQKPHH